MDARETLLVHKTYLFHQTPPPERAWPLIAAPPPVSVLPLHPHYHQCSPVQKP